VKKEWMIYAALILVGVVFAPKIRSLPLLGKLPAV